MKLLQLQELLGKEIDKLSNNEKLKAFDIDRANAISRMAKQMINNGQVILRAEKMNDSNGIVK